MSTQPKYYGPGEAPKHPQYSVQEFAARIKAKYGYADMDDQELVSSVIKKYPQYQTSLTTEALQKRAAETLPTREETQRAYAAAGPQIKPARKGLVPWLERAYGKMMYEGIPSLRIGGVPVTPKMPALTAGAGGGQRPPGQPSIAEVIAGPALGPVRAATGLARIFTQPTPEYGTAGGARGLSEILGGAMQVAPLPAMRATRGALPAFIPPFEAAMAGTRRIVEPLPISPELKELAATAIPLAGGAAIAGAPAIMRRGRAARAAPVEPVGPPRLGPAPPRRLLPPPRGPEIGIERELPGGEGVVRPVPEVARARVPPAVERAPQAQPAPPTKPLPTEPRFQATTGTVFDTVEGRTVTSGLTSAEARMRAVELNREVVAPERALPPPIDVEATIAKLKGVSAKAKETGERVARREITPEQGREQVRQAIKTVREPKPTEGIKPQPVSRQEAAELGVRPERVPEVLRRQREGEAAQRIAAERPVERPSMLEREQPVLPGMERAVREQAEAARRLEGEKLGEEFATPVEERAGKPIEAAPIFRGTEAAPQREMFAPGVKQRTVVDEFGDTIERGGRVVDSLGRSGKVRSVGALVQDLETGKAVFREDTLKVDFGKGPEPVSISEVTVKRHGRPKALEGIGGVKAREFGMTEAAQAERFAREGGFLRAEDVLPIEAIRDFTAGMKEIGKGITARFKGKEVRAPSKKVAGDLADQIDVVATKLTRDAEMLLEQTENIAETGTFQPGPPGRGARAERAARAPVRPALRVSEQMVKELNAEIVATARAVKELRAQAETTGSARLNKALRAAETQLEVLAERYRPLPKAAGRAVKAFDYPVPQEVVAEMQRVGLFLKHATKPGLSDYVYEAWVNFLLSGPQTHGVNMTSNTLFYLSRFPERAAAGGIDFLRAKLTGTPQEVFAGETAEAVFGWWRGMQEGTSKGLEAWRTETPVSSKLEIARQKAIPGRAGRVIRTPGRALIMEDEFAKGIIHRSEINALAYRTAAKEGKTGAARAKRITELIEKPTADMIQAADKEALHGTFQDPLGPYAGLVLRARAIVPGVRYIIPFMRTMTNIAKRTLERTPLNIPRVGYKIATGQFKGGAASIEVAKPLLGTVISAVAAMYALEGKITGHGPKDRNKRRVLYETGWQPYSIKWGDKYYSYNRYEPIGSLIGMAADYVELFDEMDELEQDEIIGRMALSVSRNITSKTYSRGVSSFLNAFSDPARYGGPWVETTAGTVVPTIVAQLARATDPFYREPTTILEAVKARIPGLSRQVQPKRGVFGQPARRQGGFARRFFLPPISGPLGGAPEQELARLGMGVSAPSKRIGIRGRELELSPEEYGRLQETRGGLARTMIERLVGRAAYQRMSDEQKERVIRSLMTRAGGAARGKMIRSIPRPQLQQRYAEARR